METQFEIARLLRLRARAADLGHWNDYVHYTEQLEELGYKEEKK